MSRPVRDEPSLGALDMSEVEFRRPRAGVPRADDEHRFSGLWWRIALGVFVGMLAHSIIVGIYVRWELQQLIKYLESEAALAQRDFEAALRQIAPVSSTTRDTTPTAHRSRTSPLRPLTADERCVSGKRFRRIENGWVQVLEPCR